MGEVAGDSAGGLDAEDAKLVTLARSVRARTGAAEGAAVRDDIGRTYAAATVSLSSLSLSALTAAIAAAVSSGAARLEAAAVVGDQPPESDEAGSSAASELGVPTVIRADPTGTVVGP